MATKASTHHCSLFYYIKCLSTLNSLPQDIESVLFIGPVICDHVLRKRSGGYDHGKGSGNQL